MEASLTMQFFDLHCDTLYRAVTENKTLNENIYKPEKNSFSQGVLFEVDKLPPFQLSFDRGKKYCPWIQCMAVWISDDVTDEYGKKLFDKAYLKLKEECEENHVTVCGDFSDLKSVSENKRYGVIFTLENGRLIKNIDDLTILKNCGVKMITLTWNGENFLGSGVKAEKDSGLTSLGKDVIRKMNRFGIAVDVSHGSDKLFYEAAQISTTPIAASHSNSRKITDNPRNITDEQFKIICQKGGVVGLNFCRSFLNNNPEKAVIEDILRHTEHFLSLGGENHLCIGSDFDGTDMPKGIAGIESMENLYELFLKHNYSERLVSKLFFENTYNFFENFDI